MDARHPVLQPWTRSAEVQRGGVGGGGGNVMRIGTQQLRQVYK